ncbi:MULTISPECIES: hypothetical protein [Sorangium]|uniref:hypothetical protein n=1 Tax=Sorangium TaxID=39643 RepID=UPI0005D1EB6B|nr:hypothetical protein [Sorangium cellulosum]
MSNFDTLYEAGMFPATVTKESDLGPADRDTIAVLSNDEISALISAYKRLDSTAQRKARTQLHVCGF